MSSCENLATPILNIGDKNVSICAEKTPQPSVLVEPFSEVHWVKLNVFFKKVCAGVQKEACLLQILKKLTFGGDARLFHQTATILRFQLQSRVLRTAWDVVARVGIWKHSSGATRCPAALWKTPPSSLCDVCGLWDLCWNVLNHHS